MGQKQVVGFLAVLAMAVVVSLIDVPVTQSQAACQAGTYTLNGDLTVTGKIKAANVESTQAPAASPKPSFELCSAIVSQPSWSSGEVSCPSGKFITGATCQAQQGMFPASCNINFLKNGASVESGSKGVDGARCSCMQYRQPYWVQTYATLTVFCC